MIIHQSIYGEVDRAWALIRTSQADNTFAKNIALKTDLQEQTIGTVWQPSIRGFLIDDCFLILKTFEDNTKGVRRGRKFSHVLMLNASDISKLNSIKPLFDFLTKTVDKDLQLNPIDFEIPESKQDQQKIVDTRLQKMIYGYIQIKEYRNKILWMGQNSFETAVDELWKLLTLPERRTFTFGVTFNNDPKDNQGINLFAVPDSVANRFIKTENFVVNKNEVFKPLSLLEKILQGDEEAIVRIQNFEKVSQCNQLSRAEINIVEKGIDTFEQVDSISDLKKLNTLSHLIAKYSPEESSGADFKKKLLKRIIKQLDNTTYRELSILRIFKVSSFYNSQKMLEEYLRGFIQKKIFSIKGTKADLIDFFEKLNTESDNWWDLVMVDELQAFISNINSKKVKIIFKWIIEIPNLLQRLSTFLDPSHDVEDLFINCLPAKINKQLWDEISSLCLEKSWFKFYALLLIKKYTMEQSLTELLKVDVDENYYFGINVIIDKKTPKSIVDYTVVKGDIRMVKICGQLCHEYPTLLQNLDPFNENWQQIWIEAINCGNLVIEGINNPQDIVFALLDGLLEQKQIPEFLILKISESEFGSLINYSNYNQLWKLIDGPIKKNFLYKTSTALLEELSKNPSFSIPNDPVLEEYISGKGISDYLYYNRNNIKSVIPLFERFTHLSDLNLEDYLKNYSSNIDAINAKQLGQLIMKRRFDYSASVIYKKTSRHNNWRFALAECHPVLDLYTRGKIAFFGLIDKVHITTDEWWDAVHDVLTDLYSNGNSLSTIWKKSGGKESDLLIVGSSADVWSDILLKLKYKKVKNVTMNDLLTEVNKQYGDNKNFEILYKLRLTYIKAK